MQPDDPEDTLVAGGFLERSLRLEMADFVDLVGVDRDWLV